MINVHLTKIEKDVLFNDKQFVLLNGIRGCGKSNSGVLWTFWYSSLEKTTAWVIVPNVKRLEQLVFKFRNLCAKCDRNPIVLVNRKYYFETTVAPFNSKIYFITVRDLFNVFPKGRSSPNLIFIDDADEYPASEQRKIHKRLQIEINSHCGNPKVLIAYTQRWKNDRLAALWAVTKNHLDKWHRVYGGLNESKYKKTY